MSSEYSDVLFAAPCSADHYPEFFLPGPAIPAEFQAPIPTAHGYLFSR